MQFLKKNKEYFISPLIVLVILSLIFAVKHVYPFGNGNIAYYDMNQSFIPLYSHTHDVLHGKASLFYTWFTSCSSSMFATLPSFTVSPLNLFFLFVKRENILWAMSLFLMLKMVLMSETMTFYLKKTYPLDALETIALALMYTFSGYVIQYYTNLYFLDTLILFPLIMHSIDVMLKKDNGLYYMTVMALSLVSGPYLSIFVLLFVVFYVFFRLHISEEKKNRKKAAANLGLYTVFALVISLAVTMAWALKTMMSNRININADATFWDIVSQPNNEFFGNKVFMLFGTELAAAAAAVCLFKHKKEKTKLPKGLVLRLVIIVLLVIPVVCEGSDLMWHLGTYMEFPYRFAFILSFMAADLLAYVFANYKADIKRNIPVYAVTAVLFAASLTCLVMLGSNFTQYGILNLDGYAMYAPFFVLSVIVGILIFAFFGKKERRLALLAVIVIQSSAAGLGFIAPQDYKDGAGGDAYISDCADIKKAIGMENDDLSRVKCVYPSLTSNYPLVLGIPSLSGWTNESSSIYTSQLMRMGYGLAYTRDLDNGGSAFSDAFLNIKKVVAAYPVNEDLYASPVQSGKYTVYDCRYTLPFGITAGEDIMATADDAFYTIKGMRDQNLIYRILSGKDEDIIDIADKAECVKEAYVQGGDEEKVYLYTLELPVKDRSVLYINSPLRPNPANYIFYLDGQPVNIQYFDETDSYFYPAPFYNNGIIELGSFENETVELMVQTNDEGMKELEIGFMSTAKLAEFCDSFKDKGAYDVEAKMNKLSMKVDSQNGRYVFLPIEYDKNWKAKVNGENVGVYPVLAGAFMAVPLQDGQNDIKMLYRPTELNFGLLLSLIGVFAAVLHTLKKKKFDIADTAIVKNAAYVCFVLFAAALLILFYIIPIPAGIIALFL